MIKASHRKFLCWGIEIRDWRSEISFSTMVKLFSLISDLKPLISSSKLSR